LSYRVLLIDHDGATVIKPLYIVLAVALVTWAGLFFYVVRLQSRLRRLEREAKALLDRLEEERKSGSE
jgi:CcmD family protein